MSLKKTIIIAEAGVNHNGNINLAKKLIKMASKAGADFIKFQSFKTDYIITKDAPKANYQKKINNKESQYSMLKKLELSINDHEILINECNKNNIKFMSSPFDIESIKLLKKLNLKTVKVPSSEINNYPYLKQICKYNWKIILSTGMSDLNEIKKTINFMSKNGLSKKNLTLLHCNSEYPTPFKDINLLAMKTLENETNVRIGYSDHSVGIEVPIAAVALGANVIEKHFTLSRKMKGPDHIASIEIDELSKMVKAIRNIELSLGNKNKIITNSAKSNIKTHTKSIVAIKKISKGEKFTDKNISTKRPGTGITSDNFFKIIGNKSKNNYQIDELLKKSEIK